MNKNSGVKLVALSEVVKASTSQQTQLRITKIGLEIETLTQKVKQSSSTCTLYLRSGKTFSISQSDMKKEDFNKSFFENEVRKWLEGCENISRLSPCLLLKNCKGSALLALESKTFGSYQYITIVKTNEAFELQKDWQLDYFLSGFEKQLLV